MQQDLEIVAHYLYAYEGNPIIVYLFLDNEKGERGRVAIRMNKWGWKMNEFYSTFYQCCHISGIRIASNIEIETLNLLPEHFN
jgi:hypothetical protein